MEHTSKWKEIWNRHEANLTGNEDFRTLVLELKKANGFDVVADDGVSFESWVKHIQTTLELLGNNVTSIYEVGCGSGANLVMFQNFGIPIVGGMDYSENLIRVATKATNANDFICCEASEFPEDPKYDAVISDSVTQYLPTIEYAEKVFEKMLRKAKKVIAILDVHNADLKEKWQANRKAVIDDYEEKYAGLDDAKLFIGKSFFEEFAKKHGVRIRFFDTEIENYWNGKYTYNVVMYKV